MLRTTLVALAVSAFFAGGAAADKTFNGITIDDGGKTASFTQRSGANIAPIKHDKNSTAIYDNLGHKYPNSLYFCCLGWTVSGPDSILHATNWIAVPFTPATDMSVTEMDVAVERGAGTSEIDIGVFTDNNNLPGTLIKKITVTGLPPISGCCALAVAKDRKGIPVKAGQQYWMAVMTNKTATDTFAVWVENTTDEISAGQLAGNDGTGWQLGLLLIPHLAYAIYGK